MVVSAENPFPLEVEEGLGLGNPKIDISKVKLLRKPKPQPASNESLIASLVDKHKRPNNVEEDAGRKQQRLNISSNNGQFKLGYHSRNALIAKYWAQSTWQSRAALQPQGEQESWTRLIPVPRIQELSNYANRMKMLTQHRGGQVGFSNYRFQQCLNWCGPDYNPNAFYDIYPSGLHKRGETGAHMLEEGFIRMSSDFPIELSENDVAFFMDADQTQDEFVDLDLLQWVKNVLILANYHFRGKRVVLFITYKKDHWNRAYLRVVQNALEDSPVWKGSPMPMKMEAVAAREQAADDSLHADWKRISKQKNKPVVIILMTADKGFRSILKEANAMGINSLVLSKDENSGLLRDATWAYYVHKLTGMPFNRVLHYYR